MSIESIITSLPNEVIDFLSLRNYYIDEVCFHENSFESQKTREGFDRYVRDKSHEFYFKAVEYYGKLGHRINPAICNNILEAVKNANFYGGKTENHLVNIKGIYTPKAMINSFNDGGDYFKDPKIKYEFEKKINSKEQSGKHITDESGRKFFGYGIGKEIMFSASDKIFIDTNSGTLYLGVSFFKDKN